jgi:hypothetical protein
MIPSPSATFRDPLPADYGRAEQMKRRAKRKATPPVKNPYSPIELTYSTIGKERQMARYRDLERLAMIRPLAMQHWLALPLLKRAWLTLIGHSPVSYYEAQQ